MPSPKIPCTCTLCGKEFLSDAANFKRSRGDHYCSRKCYEGKRGTIEERFWLKVHKTEDCWLWTGVADKDGYGKMGGYRRYKGNTVRTHRVSWELHFGPIPNGRLVLHRCDNPPCVRPDHLYLGTHADNNLDTWTRGGKKKLRRQVQI